jgi:glycerophosphoryl diester phosphodiesterase
MYSFFHSAQRLLRLGLKHFLILLLVGVLGPAAWGLDLQAHRGGRGLAPENTLAAFARALEIGVDTLELDIAITADGVAVISHNPDLDPALARDAGGRWLGERGPMIHTLSLAQLQAYDVGRLDPASAYARQFPEQVPSDGQRVPTLASLFELVRRAGADSVRFNIETKLFPHRPQDTVSVDSMTRTLLQTVGEAGMAGRVTIQSFDWRSLQLVQQLAPAIPTVYLSIQSPGNDNTRDSAWTAGLRLQDHGSVPRMVKAAGGAVWSPNAGALTESLVKEAQGLGLKVVPWTVNNPNEMQRLMDWGVDGLITDYPDRLRALMQQRGLPLPKPWRN